MDDLFEEMRLRQRASIEWPESEWALEYERSQLPSGIRFPRKGDVYAVKAAFPTTLMVSWQSPVTTEVGYILPPGCKITVDSDTTDRPLLVHAVPVGYAAIEKRAISRWMRWHPGYAGYRLTVSTRDLHTRFTLESSEP